MKRIFSTIVAAVAALACMALLGAPAAFAGEPTVLCKTSETPCQAKNIYPAGTAIVAETTESTGPLQIATYSYAVKCPSKLEATVGTSGGESLPLSVSSWSLGNPTDYCDAIMANNCGEGYTAGVISAEGLPYTPTVNWSEGPSLRIKPSWHISCKAGTEFLNCTFHGEPLTFVLGATGESLSVSEQAVYPSGSICPEGTPTLSVTLKIAKPETEVYVSYREPPAATTNVASYIKATKAKLNGTVNPKGIATTYWFEYGTSTSYGTKTTAKSAGSGTKDVAVSATVNGLTSGTTYHYRVVAKDEFGWESKGEDMTVVPGGPPTYRSSFGEEGSDKGQFSHPTGVAVDSSGNLWVVDKGHNRIEHWSSNGEFLSDFGEGGSEKGQLWFPTSIAIDSTGNLWVADTGNNRIEEFTPKGEFVLAVGKKGGEEGKFRSPEAVAIDPEGHVWVADTGNARLQEFTSKGSLMGTSSGGGRFCEPSGLAFNGALLYVADPCKNRIFEFAVSFGGALSFVREWGTKGSGDGQFAFVDTLAVDSEGNVWVVDGGNDRVQEFTDSGEYITKFGSYGTSAGQFRFQAPNGIAVDSSGNVWIADPLNNRVQKWSR